MGGVLLASGVNAQQAAATAQPKKPIPAWRQKGYGELLYAKPGTVAPGTMVDRDGDGIDDRLQTGPGAPPHAIGALSQGRPAVARSSVRLVDVQFDAEKETVRRYVFVEGDHRWVIAFDSTPGTSYPLRWSHEVASSTGAAGQLQAMSRNDWIELLPKLQQWRTANIELPQSGPIGVMVQRGNALFGVSSATQPARPADSNATLLPNTKKR